MENIDLNKHKNIYFIGIGGVSMSGLAETLHKKGFKVLGSDNKETELIQNLKNKGIQVNVGQKSENINNSIDLVVYTAAVKKDNPEYAKSIELNITTIDRACLMGIMMRDFKYPICVSGTHGKTTTTSMISEIFIEAEKEPTINLGGILPSINSNYLIGKSDYFIVESCEYFDSFLKFYPYVGVILNIEEDHLDYFRNLEHIENSFKKFSENISPNGTLVINNDILNIDKITEGIKCNLITYGNNEANWYSKNISYNENGFASFEIYKDDKNLGKLNLRLRGEHNIKNALAAAAAAFEMGIDIDTIKRGLEKFEGSRRRYEHKGEINGITIIDDYAHHPTEIKATLEAAKNSKYNKLYCVFQPHTFTRTKKLLKELSESFDLADYTLIVDIYSAREKDTGEIHSRDLVKAIEKRGKTAFYMSSFDEASEFLFKNCIHGDLLITMGAGDVNILGENMLRTELSTLSTV